MLLAAGVVGLVGNRKTPPPVSAGGVLVEAHGRFRGSLRSFFTVGVSSSPRPYLILVGAGVVLVCWLLNHLGSSSVPGPARPSRIPELIYYEFAAIDGPISDEGLRYPRGCPTRATVSRVRWQNTYPFGDLHGSVDTLLATAYAPAGEIAGFQQKLTGFRLRYSNRPAMPRRIEKLRQMARKPMQTGIEA